MRARHRHLQWRDKCGLYLDSRYINQSNATEVITWSDRSGNNRNQSNGTANQRPIYIKNSIGGNGVVEFDGSNDRLGGGSSVNWYQYATAFFVAQTDDTTGAKGQYVFWDGNTNTGGASFHFGILYGKTTFWGKGWNNASGPYAKSDGFTPGGMGSWMIGSAELGAASNVWENGVSPSAKTTANSSLTNAFYTFYIGYENFWPFDGKIALVAVFTDTLNAPLRKRYEKCAAYSFKIACS
jgi:hypothetical protein